MFNRIRNMHPVTGIVIGVLATLVLSGTAMAVTDASFTYSTVQTGYLMIGSGDVVPENWVDADDYTLETMSALSFAGACFFAPVHLPQGARMISVRTSYRSGPASSPSLELRRGNPVTGEITDLVSPRVIFDNSSTRTYVNDVVPADRRLVSNALYIYTYKVCVGNDDAFYGARIAYQYSSAGD